MHKLTTGIIFSLILGAILFVNYYPHYYALLKTPKKYSYSGQASWFDPWDINSYFSIIKQAQKKKSIFLDNINTTETGKAALIYPLYTTAGILFPKIDNILLYHLLAIICGTLLAFGIYILSYTLVKNAYYALYILLLVAFGGGFGFLFPSVGADLNIPGVTFLSTFQKPHEAVAALFYISSLVFFYLAIKKRHKFYWLISVLTLISLIPIYPYRLLSFFLIAGVFVLVFSEKSKERYPYKYLATLSTIILPPALVYIYHFLSSGFGVLIGYKRPSISLISLLLGYGIFILFFIYQLFLKNKKSPLEIFLNIWIIVSLGLSALPLGISRFYLSGLLFPLSILFVSSLNKLSGRLLMPVVSIIFIFSFIAAPSSLYIFNRRMAEVKNNNIWYYLSEPVKQGIDFLGSSEKDGVLVFPPLSSFIPAYTAKRVYFGLKEQTPDYDNKVNNAVQLYLGKLEEKEAENFLKKNYINFVVITDQEKQLGEFSYSFLSSVYKNKEIEILSFSE
ncbi:MAG: hypothetical protein Q8P91_01955 [bacterium]|nr:hypothetical protein [bacterium]